MKRCFSGDFFSLRWLIGCIHQLPMPSLNSRRYIGYRLTLKKRFFLAKGGDFDDGILFMRCSNHFSMHTDLCGNRITFRTTSKEGVK